MRRTDPFGSLRLAFVYDRLRRGPDELAWSMGCIMTHGDTAEPGRTAAGEAGRFLEPHLRGGRFDADPHEIPSEFLKDLAVLEELVIETAKWRHREMHSTRGRAMNNFKRGVRLNLTGVGEGSAIPSFRLHLDPAGNLFDEQRRCFDEARIAIVQTLGSASEGFDKNIGRLPPKLLTYFDRLGRNLKPGESMELSDGKGARGRLTQERRLQLLRDAQVKTYRDEVTLVGAVPSGNKQNDTFDITTDDGRSIQAPWPAPFRDQVQEAWSGFEDGVRVSVQCVGEFTKEGKLQRVESVEQLTVLSPLDVGLRLASFYALEEGWHDGEGPVLNREGLDRLTDAFDRHWPEELALPHLWPMPEPEPGGGVHAQWKDGRRSVNLEVDLSSFSAYFTSFDLDEPDLEVGVEEEDLDLSLPVTWERIAGEVRGFLGGNA